MYMKSYRLLSMSNKGHVAPSHSSYFAIVLIQWEKFGRLPDLKCLSESQPACSFPHQYSNDNINRVSQRP